MTEHKLKLAAALVTLFTALVLLANTLLAGR